MRSEVLIMVSIPSVKMEEMFLPIKHGVVTQKECNLMTLFAF